MAELGQTDDPQALVPGDPVVVGDTQRFMTAYGDVLQQAGTGLARIDGTDGWSGPASAQFRDTFQAQSGKWIKAGQAFHGAGGALARYVAKLTWAQDQAADAIRMWREGDAATASARDKHDAEVAQAQKDAAAKPSIGPPLFPPVIAFVDPGEGKRTAARQKLDAARAELEIAGDAAVSAVGDARDKAPEKPDFWDDVGDIAGDIGDALTGAGSDVLNSLASLGNAAIQHPLDPLLALGGAALTVASTGGEGIGLALSATGVGAPVGAPLAAISAAGIATGLTATGVGVTRMAQNANGDDSVELVGHGGGGTPPAGSAPPGLGASVRIEVTDETIRRAMKGAPLKDIQGEVSLPKIKRYVKRLEDGEIPPPIAVKDGKILDGLHRYVAGRIYRREPGLATPEQMRHLAPLKPHETPIPWERLRIGKMDWSDG